MNDLIFDMLKNIFPPNQFKICFIALILQAVYSIMLQIFDYFIALQI